MKQQLTIELETDDYGHCSMYISFRPNSISSDDLGFLIGYAQRSLMEFSESAFASFDHENQDYFLSGFAEGVHRCANGESRLNMEATDDDQ